MSIWKSIFLYIVTIFIYGCTTSHDINLNDVSEFTVYLYENNTGRNEISLREGDLAFEKISAWIKKNRTGWDYYLATAATGDFQIYSESFNLKVKGGWVVLNYTDENGNHNQLSKNVDSSDFKFIYELNRNY